MPAGPTEPEVPAEPRLPWTRADGACLGGLAAVTALLFGRVLGFPFVNWDDVHFLIENPVVHGFSLNHLQRVLIPGGVPRELIYIPLTYISHMVEASVLGLTPGVVHGTNLCLHLVNVGLVYVFCRQLSGRRAVALLAALPFALHPLQVEAVAWAMGRKDLLSTVFGMAALIFYVRFIRSGSRNWLGGTLVLFCLAVLAKPSFIVLPAVLVLIDLYVPGPDEPRHWGHKIPFVLIALLTYWINSRMPTQVSADAPSLGLRLICVPWVGFEWVRRFLLFGVPVPFYVWPSPDRMAHLAIAGGVFTVALAAALWFAWRRRWQPVWFGLLFFSIAFLPAVSIIVQPRDFITADRYGYFPLVGVFYLVAVGLMSLPVTWRAVTRVAYGIWLAGCVVGAFEQLSVWKDSVALWSTAAAHYPENAIIRNNLGMAYVDAGDPAFAVDQFKRGQMLAPRLEVLYNNLGQVYLEQGQVSDAIAQFRVCLSLSPGDATAWRNLGDALLAKDDMAGALDAYQRAIQLKPGFADAYLSLGNALLRQGRATEAETAYRQGLVHSPRNAALHYNLGLVLERLNRPTEALDAYSLAVLLDPSLPDAWYNLGTLFLGAGKLREARNAFSEALRLREDADTRINLGVVLLQTGDFAGAIASFNRALELETPHAARVWFFIAQAHQRQNQRAKALAALDQALKLDPNLAEAAQLKQALQSKP